MANISMQRPVVAIPSAAPTAALPLRVPPAPYCLPLASARSPSHTPSYSTSPCRSRNNSSCSGTPTAFFGNTRPRSVSTQQVREEETRHAPPAESRKYGIGVDVEIGEHHFRCLDMLGKGSYSEVWRAEVLKGGSGEHEVALKEVRCRSQAELHQAIFEVQVLLALERSASASTCEKMRVPRCISYNADPYNDGWKVRTAMTVVPGESLDVLIRHKPTPGVMRDHATKRAVLLVSKLLRDVSPTLLLLTPIAFHRDVNSHNILIDTVQNDSTDAQEIEQNTSFWLIDFGLAVDSQTWRGKWRTEDIGGDSRYWPPSSWIMHLLGPEGFRGCPELCDQYQWRLDIHGLGITALELLCTLAYAAPPVEDQRKDLSDAWEQIFAAWHRYYEDVWRWWAAVYKVFSTGGEIAPVQAKMVEDRVVEQHLMLLSNIRFALRQCAPLEEEATSYVLSTIADLIDEKCTFELTDIPAMLGGKASATSVVAADLRVNFNSSATASPQAHSSVVFRNNPRSPSSPMNQHGSNYPRPASLHASQVALPLPTHDRQAQAQISPAPMQKSPLVLRYVSPSRGRSPLRARSPQTDVDMSNQSESGPIRLPSSSVTPRDQRSLRSTGRPCAATIVCTSSMENSSRLSSLRSVDATMGRYKSASAISTASISASTDKSHFPTPRATSIEPQPLDHREAHMDRSTSPNPRISHVHRSTHLPMPPENIQPQTPTQTGMDRSTSPNRRIAHSMSTGNVHRSSHLHMAPQTIRSQTPIKIGVDRSTSPNRRIAHSISTNNVHRSFHLPMAPETIQSQTPRRIQAAPQAQWNTVLPEIISQHRQPSALHERQISQSGRYVDEENLASGRHAQSRDMRSSNTPLSSSRRMLAEPGNVRAVLSVPHSAVTEEPLTGPAVIVSVGQTMCTVTGPGMTPSASESRIRTVSADSTVLQPESFSATRSPRPDSKMQRSYAGFKEVRGPLLPSSLASLGATQAQQRLPSPWLPPPRELTTRSSLGSSDSRSVEVLEHARQRTLPGASLGNGYQAAAMTSRLTEAMAGLSVGVAAAQQNNKVANQSIDFLRRSGEADVGAGPYPPSSDDVEAQRQGHSQESKERMRNVVAGGEHEILIDKIQNLEESLQRLGRESFERAKLGMEKLTEKYFPKAPGRGDDNQSAVADQMRSPSSTTQAESVGSYILPIEADSLGM